jgi:hypothetical protein
MMLPRNNTTVRSSIPKVLAKSIHFGYNPSMMKFFQDLLQAAVAAVLFFGPLFYFFLFQMKP